jgi:very-short-patch-repair endonuclease
MPAHRKPLDEYLKRECPVCGTSYLVNPTRLKHGRGTTCSRKCSYALRGAGQAQDRVAFVCGTCGKEFTRAPYQVKGKHGAHFCSRDCHYIGRTLGISKRVVTEPYQYTEGGRTKLSVAAALAYARGNTLTYPESELALADALARTGIAFIHQHVIEGNGRAYVADFYFPGRDLVIEVDAPEHHAKPRNATRDRELDAILGNAGIRVARIPDNGVPHEVVQAALLVLA